MKSYNHLFEKLIEEDNIELAIRNASLGKRDRREVKKVLENIDEYIPYYQKMVSSFKNAKHRPKEIYDGTRRKKRTIIVPTFDEQVVHHMLVNILKPIFLRSMYYHSYGSLPNKGSHKAKAYISKWLKADERNTVYCLQMDVKKFFESVPHDILKSRLCEIIHDEKFTKVLFEVIDVLQIGLPLGFYTSQWLANWYLTSLDHYIKEDLDAVYYVRYMDDMIIFDSDKKKLHDIRKRIESYLQEILGLELKGNWQVFKVNIKPLDFLGFRFHRNRVVLRKSIMLRMTRKAKRLSKKRKASIYDARQMLSYLGWISATNVYNVYLKYIKPFVSFGKLKKKISAHDRRNVTCGKLNIAM